MALRLIAWCWALALFRRAEPLTPALFARVREAVGAHARHVEPLPVALLLAQHAPHRRGARPVLRRASVRRPARRGRLAADRARSARARERAAGPPRRRLLRAVDVLPALHGRDLPALPRARRTQRPARCRPPCGRASARCSTGSRTSAGRTAPSPRSAMRTAAGCCRWRPARPTTRGTSRDRRRPCFGRADYAWAAGGGAGDAVAARRARAGRGAAATARARRERSRVFSDGGYVVMRRWVARAPAHLRRGAARLPDQRRPRPRRPAERAVHGVRRAVPGGRRDRLLHAGRRVARVLPLHRGPQHGERRRREPGRARAARSRWTQRPARAAAPLDARPRALDFADAEHDAYARLADPVRHRRRVLFDQAALLAGRGRPRRARRAPRRGPLPARAAGRRRRGRRRGRGRAGAAISWSAPFSRPRCTRRARGGRPLPPRGWISPAYGERVPAPSLTCATVTPPAAARADRAPRGRARGRTRRGSARRRERRAGGRGLDGGGEMRVADDRVRAGHAVERW